MATHDGAHDGAPEARLPRVVIFSSIHADQSRRHEELLREMGLEPTTRDMPRSAPIVDKFDAVCAVSDHAEAGGEQRVQLAAKRANKRFFKLTKKTSHPTWEGLRQWAREQADYDSPVPPWENETAPPSNVVQLPLPEPSELDQAHAEATQWEGLAKDYDAQRQQAEDALTLVRGELQQAEAEIENARAAVESMRRTQVASVGELTDLRKDNAALREDRAGNDRRLRNAQSELATARAEATRLREALTESETALEIEVRARDERPSVTAAPSSKELDNARRAAASYWDLVDTEQMDLEEAFIRLARAVGVER